MTLSTPARSAPGLPFLNARCRAVAPSLVQADQLSAALLATGVFPAPTAFGSPRSALKSICESMSGGASGDTQLSVELWEQDGQALLSLRHRQVLMYSLAAARPAFDRASRGLLGRLMSDLRHAAALHAPMYTPETVLHDHAAQQEEYQEELLYQALGARLTGMTSSQITAALQQVSPRDAAKILARNGHRTSLQAHEAGATLGLNRLFTPRASLEAEIAKLPSALAASVLAVRGVIAELGAFPQLPDDLPPGLLDDLDDAWGPLVHPAFLVIASLDAHHDPVSETLNEQWQQCCEYGDTVPFATFPFETRADHRRAALVLKRACRALRLVRRALKALGAEEC